MYEQPSMHMELARLRHKDFQVEAARARLAAQVEREPHEALALVRSVASCLRNTLSRRPAAVRAARLQTSV